MKVTLNLANRRGVHVFEAPTTKEALEAAIKKLLPGYSLSPPSGFTGPVIAPGSKLSPEGFSLVDPDWPKEFPPDPWLDSD